MESFVAFIEWIMTLCFALGAVFAVWTLEACTDVATIVCRRINPKMRPNDIAMVGGALYLGLMIGLPVIAVMVGFITGRLPVKPA